MTSNKLEDLLHLVGWFSWTLPHCLLQVFWVTVRHEISVYSIRSSFPLSATLFCNSIS